MSKRVRDLTQVRGKLRDLSNVETVYSRRIQLETIRVTLRRRKASTDDLELMTIGCVADVETVVQAIFSSTVDDDQEHFVILVLNAAHELVGYKLIGSGKQDHVYVDPKIVFRNALLLGAQAIVLAHNHPSGSPNPSPADISLTVKLVEMGRLMELNVLDHVIYSHRKGQVSMREKFPHLFPQESG